MSILTYKQALRESGHVALSWIDPNEAKSFSEKISKFGFCDTEDIFLVRSDDAEKKQKNVVSTGAELIDDGIFRACKIDDKNLLSFERAKWILCVRLKNMGEINSLFESSADQYLVSNFVPPSQLVKKLIRNFSKADPNCFVIFNPAWPADFTIVGDDSLFDLVVANAKENALFQAERGDLTHCRKTRKNLYPATLIMQDRIEAINPTKIPKMPKPTFVKEKPRQEEGLVKVKERYYACGLTGSSWFIDSSNVAHLTFFTQNQLTRETQELLDHLAEVESSAGVDGEKLISIGAFAGSGDRIALMLSGPHAGAVIMFFHDVDDQIISTSLLEFISELKSKSMSLLKRFGAQNFDLDGKLTMPNNL